MAEIFNIYCDESCHLERDNCAVMVLGAVWCKQTKAREISVRLREIKAKHELSPTFEAKWTKVSASKVAYYKEVVDYFFDDDDLHFRGILVPDKGVLDHEARGQTHDEWYYKMLFTLLEPIIVPHDKYCIYLDIKDTHAAKRCDQLERVLCNWRKDPEGKVVERVQPIRSHESEILQLTDLLIGAIGYRNRKLATNQGKIAVIERIIRRSGKTLTATTWLREPKVNLLRWKHSEGEAHDS